MKPYLISIIGSYLNSCTCSYETLTLGSSWQKKFNQKFDPAVLKNIWWSEYIRNLKLDLRTIKEIGHEEMLMLWKLPPSDIHISEDYEILKADMEDFRIEVFNGIYCQFTVLEINYLRSIGICVDKELINEGYVELKTIA